VRQIEFEFIFDQMLVWEVKQACVRKTYILKFI
jgi:hypothetical protein